MFALYYFKKYIFQFENLKIYPILGITQWIEEFLISLESSWNVDV
jgi:hypothetical protein